MTDLGPNSIVGEDCRTAVRSLRDRTAQLISDSEKLAGDLDVIVRSLRDGTRIPEDIDPQRLTSLRSALAKLIADVEALASRLNLAATETVIEPSLIGVASRLAAIENDLQRLDQG